MNRFESSIAGVVRRVAAALMLWLLEALCAGGSQAAAQSASFAWLTLGGETYQTTVLGGTAEADMNPVSSGVATAVGAAGGVFLDRLYLGGAAEVLLPRSSGTDAVDMRVAGGSGSVHVGYGLLLRDRFMLYPTVGLGMGGTEVLLTPSGGENAVGGTSKFHTAFGTATVQLNGDVMKRSSPAGSAASGPAVGWSVGIHHTFGRGNWRLRSGPGHAGGSVPINADRTALKIAVRIGWGVKAFR